VLPVHAEVVDAVLQPVAPALRACAGAGSARVQLGGPAPALHPAVTVLIEFRGTLAGFVAWEFELRLARQAAATMLGIPRADARISADAAGELANIIAGNAVGLLADAGHRVEILPFVLASEREALVDEDAPAFTYATPVGTVRMTVQLWTRPATVRPEAR
jgi:CheY-specific phosphatase CheX